eukprot:352532_1
MHVSDVSTLCGNYEHVKCILLLISHCRSCDLEVLQKIFIHAVSYTIREPARQVINQILSLAEQLNIERRELFDYNYVNEEGVNALYAALAHGRMKWIQMMLKSLDIKSNKAMQFLSGFTTYNGRNLMHAVCELHSNAPQR